MRTTGDSLLWRLICWLAKLSLDKFYTVQIVYFLYKSLSFALGQSGVSIARLFYYYSRKLSLLPSLSLFVFCDISKFFVCFVIGYLVKLLWLWKLCFSNSIYIIVNFGRYLLNDLYFVFRNLSQNSSVVFRGNLTMIFIHLYLCTFSAISVWICIVCAAIVLLIIQTIKRLLRLFLNIFVDFERCLYNYFSFVLL